MTASYPIQHLRDFVLSPDEFVRVRERRVLTLPGEELVRTRPRASSADAEEIFFQHGEEDLQNSPCLLGTHLQLEHAHDIIVIPDVPPNVLGRITRFR